MRLKTSLTSAAARVVTD